MEIIYANTKIEEQCTNKKAAKKLFGGNKSLSMSLFSRINAIECANTIHDIVVMPSFHFHKLMNKDNKDLEGYFGIDVKSRNDQWRIIVQPLDDNKEPYNPCNIDEVSKGVKIVKIMEVSKHYE